MKKVLVGLLAVVLFASVSRADVYDFTATTTNGQAATISAQVPNVSGYLEKIELFNTQATATGAVIVATYNAANTTAVDTYATVTLSSTTPKVVRLRVAGMDNTGTAIPAVVSAANTNGMGTILTVPYTLPLIGSNLRVSVAGTDVPAATTNTVHVRFFYIPLPTR